MLVLYSNFFNYYCLILYVMIQEEALEEEEEEEGSSIYKKDGSFKCYVVDTLTELNLKETSEFVKAFAVVNKNVNAGQQRRSSSSSTSIGVTSVTPPTDAQPPPTPCRPIFNFTSTSNTSAIGIANTNTNNHHRISSSSFSTTRNNYMMTIPSKWDDAQKWLINHSPSAHNKQPLAPPPPQQQEHVLSSDKPKGMFHRSISLKANRHHHHTNTNTNSSFTSMASHGGGEDPTKPHSLLLQGNKLTALSSSPRRSVHKQYILNSTLASNITLNLDADKFTDEVEQNYKCLEPTKEGFLFGNSKDKFVQKAAAAATGATFHEEVKHRDIGTEMTPLGSSTTSRCNTPPFKTSSPARHNTPSNTSGPLQHSTNHNIDISQFQDCHLAKLQLPTQYDSVTSNWSSREEEEEEISKSLRHFEMSNDFVCAKNVSESAVSYDWKAEEKTKCCLRSLSF